MSEPPAQPLGKSQSPSAADRMAEPEPGTPGVVLYITSAIESYIQLDQRFDWNHPDSSEDPHIPAGTQQRMYIATARGSGQEINVTCGLKDGQQRLWAELIMRCPLFGANSVVLIYDRSDSEAAADSQRSAIKQMSGPDDEQMFITVTSFNTHLSPLYVHVSIVGRTRRSPM